MRVFVLDYLSCFFSAIFSTAFSAMFGFRFLNIAGLFFWSSSDWIMGFFRNRFRTTSIAYAMIR